MKRILVILIVAMVILISCGKKEAGNEAVVADKNGVKNFSNTSTPTDPTAKLELKKLFTISGESEDSLAAFNRALSMTSDREGNIYILDLNSMSLKKFDKDGQFIKSIGRRGQEPGELYYPSFVLLLDDTLNIMSQQTKKISKFTRDGEFIMDTRLDMDVQLPKTYDNKNIISYTVRFDPASPDQVIYFSLSSLDKNFKVTNDFEKREIPMQDFANQKVKISDLLIPFVPGKGSVFLSGNDDNEYRINEYDMTGKKTMSIKKQFKRIKVSEEEKKIFEERMARNNGQGMKLDNFKKALSDFHYDKYGRLLVVPEIDRKDDKQGSYIDIFKDGVFLNRVNFEINKDSEYLGGFSFTQKQLFFIDDRLYVLNVEEMTVDVYDY